MTAEEKTVSEVCIQIADKPTRGPTLIDRDKVLAGLNYVVQYRRKEDYDPWHIMAAFDVEGAAESYCAKQGGDDMPWEYRWCEIAPASTD